MRFHAAIIVGVSLACNNLQRPETGAVMAFSAVNPSSSSASSNISNNNNNKPSKVKTTSGGRFVNPFGGGGGGRQSITPDMPNLKDDREDPDDSRWQPTPPKPSEARLTVVQITDVYTLENFASLKTMLKETREKIKEYRCINDNEVMNKEDLPQTLTKSETGVISMLTGDFLAPYLLSSVDRGKGMMKALAQTPIDYLTWVSATESREQIVGELFVCVINSDLFLYFSGQPRS